MSNSVEYDLVVTLKSGNDITIHYGGNPQKLYFDIDILENSFADNSCDGYIGGKDVGTIVKCREIAAVQIKPITIISVMDDRDAERLKDLARHIYGYFDDCK